MCLNIVNNTYSAFQGMCHICWVPRNEMDNILDSYPSRTQTNVESKVSDAARGVYPGWNSKTSQHGAVHFDHSKEPSPLFELDEDGISQIVNQTKLKEAQSALGVHIVFNELWRVPHFDPYTQV